MSVQIIIDSTIDIQDEIKNQCIIVPLTVRFGEQEYLDGVDIDHETFYHKLVQSDVLPTTSQAPPSAFMEVFEKIVQHGDTAVVITIAAKLSGTYQNAKIAAEKYPENIFVVDSNTVSIGAGILLQRAWALKAEGMHADQIAKKLEEEKDKIHIIALFDTLEYLRKGGRISGAAAFAGGLLSIKLIVAAQDGEIRMIGKTRGLKQGHHLLVQEIQKVGGMDLAKPVLLGYTGLNSDLWEKCLEDTKDFWANGVGKSDVINIGSVIGTHAGPGAIAAAFFKN